MYQRNKVRAREPNRSTKPPSKEQLSSEERGDVVLVLLDTLARLSCLGRKAQITNLNLGQAIQDGLYRSKGWPDHRIDTGSAFEGFPWAVCGDRDVMICKRSYPIVKKENDSSSKEDATVDYVIAEPSIEIPAFLKLKVPVHHMDVNEPDTLLGVISEIHGGSIYACSERFVHVTGQKGREIHGPATTGPTVKGHSQYGTQDIVQCLYSPEWPSQTEEYLTRYRAGKWPSEDQVKNLTSLGCHVVGVGYPEHPEKRLQWRWSFSVAEKILLHNISEEVFIAMYLLKVIKQIKEVTEWSGLATGICTYYVKTTALWVSEQMTHPLDVVSAIIKLLDWLIKAYEKRFLPHYFIPKHNLICHLPASLCEELAAQLRDVKSNIRTLIMASLEWGGMPKAAWERLTEPTGIFPQSRLKMGSYKYLPLGPIPKETHGKIVRMIADLKEGSDLYVKQKRMKISEWLSCDYEIISQVTWLFLKQENPDKDVLEIPESLVLPVLDDAQKLLANDYVDIFTSCLYRILGDCYLYLWAYYKHLQTLDDREKYAPFLATCFSKAEEYYKRGLNLDYPDCYSNKGISGRCRLAILYHLTGEKEYFQQLLKDNLPTLLSYRKFSKSMFGAVHPINYLPDVSIRTDLHFSKLLWSLDEQLNNTLTSRSDDILVQVNPFTLFCYFYNIEPTMRGEEKIYHLTKWISSDEIFSTRARMSHEQMSKFVNYNYPNP